MAKRKKKLANLPSKQAVEDKLRPGPGVRRMGGAGSQEASSPKTEKKRLPAANGDLVNMAMELQESIRGAYRLHEEHRPVMLFDVEEQRLYANPYQGYKETLSERSQAMLERQYQEAQQRDQIVVFVRDNETRRLISLSIDYE